MQYRYTFYLVGGQTVTAWADFSEIHDNPEKILMDRLSEGWKPGQQATWSNSGGGVLVDLSKVSAIMIKEEKPDGDLWMKTEKVGDF